MKIIFISKFQGRIERGVENYVAQLAPRLTELGFKTEILTSFWQLIGKKADIIYPLNGYWQTVGCRIYCWMTGAKLVVGGHAGLGRDDRWNLYCFPDLFIAFSKKGYDWAQKVNSYIEMIRIPHGVDLKKFNPQVAPKKLDLQKPIYITVSHLVPYKRVGETVKALSLLKRGSLLVLGEGPLEKDIDEMGNRLLGPRRYLRLAVSHNEVPRYLTASGVFTLVSDSYEAFGLVYLEALACNLPVVATDDPLRHELIEDAGLFVDNPRNTKEYAGSLEEVLDIDWNNKQVLQAGKFDWLKFVKLYEAEFSRLVA